MKLYQIWWSGRNWSRPMVDMISITPYYRNDVIGTNHEKLEKFCKYLNEISGDDETYELREVEAEEWQTH